MNNFFLIGLPYMAIAVMLIGSIIRYRVSAFQYSSLSSQFLEGKTLFFGIRPFHWGIMFLFFGHLIGFLFPESVLAWNEKTMRLLIIEIGAFGFGISALYGLVILVYRRLTNKRILIVTSKMDAFVYVILAVQIITGLWIAFFHRWGSTWFATILTPYLRSLFTLTPDISVVITLPIMVKIHIVSAFTILGFIPFTRFVHFLVYPFRYTYRSYQRVIWNWDPKTIRTSNKMVNGVRAKNV